MILKNYQIGKINFNLNNLILFYGKNEGFKNEAINNLTKNKKEISIYEEKEILDNPNNFFENVVSKSLFETEKLIIIKRASDKIIKYIDDLSSENLKDITIIINADNLEKKSKLRSLFEKNKKYICVAFYPDDDQTLSKLSYNFIKKKNVSISPANINLIVSKCNGDREKLINELIKIEYYSKSKKKITQENISKLINLGENHSIYELIDSCLVKNKKKIINILNENIFTSEDCIVIIRSFIIKTKKLLILSNTFEINKNIDLTISSSRPPIFWKDKELTKQQIYKWKTKNIKELIYKLTEIELLIKKNVSNSVNVVTDFILDQSSSNINN